VVVVKRADATGLYEGIVERLFLDHWRKGAKTVDFHRSDIQTVATALGVALPKNLGDLIYAYRFRKALPERIAQTAPAGQEWVIELVGGSTYRFSLTQASRIRPQASLALIDIPDATPDIVLRYAQGDEQALLAKLRYNRLIDVFLGIATYSLQNHLRTSIRMPKGRTQIEIDELYVGVNVDGEHFVVPVQAKGGSDQIGIVQAQQDVQFCAERFPDLKCRPVAAQFLADGAIALFELVLSGAALRIKQERHYRLVDTEPYSPGAR
jgi:DNA-binding CsgD family transcriptional regulator